MLDEKRAERKREGVRDKAQDRMGKPPAGGNPLGASRGGQGANREKRQGARSSALTPHSFPSQELFESFAWTIRFEPSLTRLLFAVITFAPRHADVFVQ